MSRFIAIILILVAISIVLWARFKTITSKIKIKISLGGLGVVDFFKSFEKEENTTLKSTLLITIHNGNSFSIPVKNLYVKIYKDGNLIARSLDVDTNKARVSIPGEGSVSFEHKGEIFIVDQLFNIFKGKLEFDYKVKMRIYGMPVSFTNTFEEKIEEPKENE